MKNTVPSDYIWAKSSVDQTQWLPLWLHLRDTLQVSEWLWDNFVSDKHKSMMAHDLGFNEIQCKKLFSLLSGLHDLGKSTPDFSGRKSVSFRTYPLYSRMVDNGFDYNSFIIQRSANSGSVVRHEVASEYFISNFMQLGNNFKYTAPTVLSLISSHHGNPKIIDSHSKTFFDAMDDEQSADYLWVSSAKNLFEFIIQHDSEYRSLFLEALKIGLSWRSQMVFSAYLSMADWIASSEDYFPLINFELVPEYSWDFCDDRCNNAVKRLEIPPVFDSQKINLNVPTSVMFNNRFGFSTPRPIQIELVELVKDENVNPSDIFILEAPMGEGKTEASLVASEILMKRSNSTGIFIGLPTMATGEAIYSRAVPYIEKLAEETQQYTTIELAHSKSLISNNRQNVTKNAWQNKKEYGIIPQGWFSGKYLKLLNSFVIGTVDNFLMMQLKSSYGYWKHLAFSQKVIIIDEVHSMDEVMKHYLEECLLMAGFYNCPVILCSATLRTEERENYIEFYNKGKALGESITYGSNQ